MKVTRVVALVATTLIATSAPSLAAAPANENIRGAIVSSTASDLVVKTSRAPVTIHLGPNVFYASAVTASSADIVPGAFLGIASVPGVAANRALEVVVFDESMRGLGEGDYPWDLPGPHGHSAMTNGTVAAPHSTMTNATVGKVGGTAQKTITMNYKGGSRKIVVPANVPIVRVSSATRAILVPGAAVFVIATKTATPDAAFVVVGKDGVKPPM